jgi:drug/metabolite transporter (DMT)-like permease
MQRAWIGFWVLALVWGSSFFFIRVGVTEMPPMQIVFVRTAIAALGLNLVIWMQGKRLPTDRQGISSLFFLGIVNTVLPFVLITWGEIYIESSLASILQGTAALFTLIVAHFAFADERITARKIAGLLVGFLGVVVLAGRSDAGNTSDTSALLHLLGQLAIIAASICYAFGGVFARKVTLGRIDPFVTAAGAMTVAAVTSGILTYFILPWSVGTSPVAFSALSPAVLGAVLALGVINTFGAYLIYYPLVVVLGAARTSMVTYVIPVVGLVLGALILDEQIDARLLLGAALILGSIAIVNLQMPGKCAPVAVATQSTKAEATRGKGT